MTYDAHVARDGPRHVGIIMDGNGRWASRRGRPRIVGHRVATEAVRRTVTAAARLGLEQLTLHTFSTENWRRPPAEVDFLMRLFARFLRSESVSLARQDIRLMAIGRLHELPPSVQVALEEAMDRTRGGKTMTLCLAVNYGGRAEIVDACRRLGCRIRAGDVGPEHIDERLLTTWMYQPAMPPLDLIIRTGGEMRLSNFLLWQAAYAEIWVTEVCWPDFDETLLRQAITAFRGRERRFGAVSPAPANALPGAAVSP